MPDDEELVQVFVPPLAQVLYDAETEKGSPLTEDEVNSIRDAAICITLRASVAQAMEDKRGRDIDPEHAWAQWRVFREQLQTEDDAEESE
jgi:hypothetical protein